MTDLSSQDPLLNLMKMERELFMRDKAHLPTAERERQWAARTVELTTALWSAIATGPIDPARSIHTDIFDTEYLSSEQRTAMTPASAAGMARCHSVNLSTWSGLPFPS